jgi:hypothetical protein
MNFGQPHEHGPAENRKDRQMTAEDKSQRPKEEGHPTEQGVAPETQPEEEELTPFVDKVIAFAVLALPFSALLAWVRDVLIEPLGQRVAHIVLLIGIVTFLLSLGNAAKWIHRVRTRHKR